MLRISDAWHQPLPSDLLQMRDAPEEEDPDVIPDPIRAPQFVQDLHELADRHGAFTNLDEYGVLRIRTWYLHHHNERRCWHPRILEYDEDWRRWESDLGIAWRSHIRPNEEIQIHVATPDPFRGYMSRPVHADVIISQGHWLPHYSTVITVHRLGRSHAPLSYALACSLERRVSGVRLVDEADVLPICNQANSRCSITFGWNRIPFTMQPTHDVRAGHAFTVQVGDDESGVAQSSSSARPHLPAAHTSTTAPDEVDYDMTEEGSEVDEGGPRDPAASPSESSLHSSDLSLLVYRLNAPDAHGFTQGRNYVAILNAAIRACRLPRNLVRCQHALVVDPVGVMPEHETAVILQTVDDITPGSDEKLVLADVEIHFHPLRDGLVVPAAHSRKVMKVNPHLHRDQILILHGLRDYCQLERDRCVVHCNQQLWPAHDRGVRDIQHGFYFRIVIPPPTDTELDTEVAIGIAREFDIGTSPPQNNNRGCTSALALRQLDASTSSTPTALTNRGDPALPECPHSADQVGAQRGTSSIPTASFHQRFAPGAQRQLEALLHQADLIECEEEGQVMYITTWYVHHRRARRCYDGRPVRLTQDTTDWLENILEPWAPLLDPTQTAVIRVVRSTPPCNPWECVQAHVIIEQDRVVRQVSCLISHHDWRYPDQGWHHRALAIEDFQNSRSLLEAAELRRMCQLVQCNVQARGLPFALVDFEEIGSAWNFVIHIQRPLLQIPQEPIELSDFNSLMQQAPAQHGQQAPAQNGLDMPPQGGECGHFDFDPLAPAFGPNQPNIWNVPEDIQELHDIWRTEAWAWEQERPAAHFMVWFLCPGGGRRRCLYGRRVTLFEDFTSWRERLTFVWRDHVIPTVPVEIHVVDPQPEPMEDDITAHILLVQLMPDHEAGVLVNLADSAVNQAQPFRVAITVDDPSHVAIFLRETGYANEQAVIALRFRQRDIEPGQLTPARTGNCFDMTVTRITLPPNWIPPILPAIPGAEGLGLLQTKATVISKGHNERLTYGQVAHTHRPLSAPTDIAEATQNTPTIVLADALMTAVEIVAGGLQPMFPSYIEVPFFFAADDIEKEILAFGIDCCAFLFGRHRKALCIPKTQLTVQRLFHVIFAHNNTCVHEGTFVHSFSDPWTEVELMKVLHQFGFEKALILSMKEHNAHFTTVVFDESHGQLESKQKLRPLRPWPQKQPTPSPRPLFEPSGNCDSQCMLKLGTDVQDLINFFQPQVDILCHHFEGVELPPVTVAAIDTLGPTLAIDRFDRLIIYVDGTSQPSQKHLPPMRVDAEGLPDAWAFLVLGEKYDEHEHEASTLHLLGWQAQQLRYDLDSPNYAGATKISSHIAEREGLFFAALWRATLNTNLPTVFRSDSWLTCGQATGSIGSLALDLSFSLLRSIFQFLEVAMDDKGIVVEHIYGHNDDPWNEAVDVIAKAEARRSHFLPRLDVDLRKWKKIIPFLWMLSGERYGCPVFCGQGFDVCAPDLPPPTAEPDAGPHAQVSRSRPQHQAPIELCISLASANVSTLGVGARGLAGKLDYIKDQFCSFQLNFLGVQESRTSEGQLCDKGLLRLCSGADAKNLGVELWCNLRQPIGHCQGQPTFLRDKDFRVLHRDPRRLLVTVQTAVWEANIFVGHAPHSGFSLTERTQWWEQTTTILHSQAPGLPLYALFDANAAPGPCDHKIVFGPGFSTSSSTALWRQFLVTHDLCLPATSALHVGPRHTWVAPDGGGKHLIDYVAIPQLQLTHCTWSQTIDQFDLNPLHEDHLAVGLQLSWAVACEASPALAKAKRKACDRGAIESADLAQALHGPIGVTWHMDIEKHVANINQLFEAELACHCPKKPLLPKKAFITEKLWALRRNKLCLRRRLQQA